VVVEWVGFVHDAQGTDTRSCADPSQTRAAEPARRDAVDANARVIEYPQRTRSTRTRTSLIPPPAEVD
jgi:hypothetical protein